VTEELKTSPCEPPIKSLKIALFPRIFTGKLVRESHPPALFNQPCDPFAGHRQDSVIRAIEAERKIESIRRTKGVQLSDYCLIVFGILKPPHLDPE